MSGATPVLLVAGALGAGKTSLIARWIAQPGFAASVVLVNELGEGAIDAHRVGGYAGATRSVAGGCACCTARGALAGALEALDATGPRVPRFERVIVELAGIAHPLPVLEDLAADTLLRERFPLHGLVCLVDAIDGTRALEGAEARACVVAADVLLLSRAAQVPAGALARLLEALARINPHAEILSADGPAAASADEAWDAAGAAPGRALRWTEVLVDGGTVHDAPRAARASLAPVHGEALGVHTLRFAKPVELSGFCMRLAAFLDSQAGAVLRAKGLVAVKGRKGPAVIQAVGRELLPVRTLKEWPAGAAPGMLRLVTRGIDAAAVHAAVH